ncbi:glycosyltransferase family 4 protein [Cellulomonas gilvus]|uniref:Glycosyl transferase group 1 n=1 Tax=Cellulomonas gilvus (strain ATCC 13127 / NRRL B-14078) TaxID=593907 RepID=F8A173_CELGA|nr:glycosyltransferase family 4 protein [Cellulomonas gilvus]AEI11620.1 glycosyl transferase group 1 [Cellulomonas gilvus ATCC 13127]
MRVLVCTVVHDPQDARIRFRQIEALLAAGHEVTYAAPFTAYGRTAPDGVRAVDLARATGRHRLRAVLAARRTLAGLAGSHDVVLLHDPELLLAVMRSATLRRTVVVWDVHEDTAAAVGMRAWVPRLLRRIARAGVRVLETWAEKHVRLLLAEHAYAERFARPHPVVPNSVVVPDHVTTTTQRDESGRLRVVYLGRVTYARGARVLLDLAPLLPRDVVLEVIGPADDDLRTALEAARGDGALVWRGFVPNDEALHRLDGALAGLSLLRAEPNYAHSRPTKLMEYMAHGVAVISTPNPASRELVERTQAGVLVPFDDASAVADAVRRLVEDDELRARMATSGRAAALAELDWAADGRRFVATLEGWAARS